MHSGLRSVRPLEKKTLYLVSKNAATAPGGVRRAANTNVFSCRLNVCIATRYILSRSVAYLCGS